MPLLFNFLYLRSYRKTFVLFLTIAHVVRLPSPQKCQSSTLPVEVLESWHSIELDSSLAAIAPAAVPDDLETLKRIHVLRESIGCLRRRILEWVLALRYLR